MSKHKFLFKHSVLYNNSKSVDFQNLATDFESNNIAPAVTTDNQGQTQGTSQNSQETNGGTSNESLEALILQEQKKYEQEPIKSIAYWLSLPSSWSLTESGYQSPLTVGNDDPKLRLATGAFRQGSSSTSSVSSSSSSLLMPTEGYKIDTTPQDNPHLASSAVTNSGYTGNYYHDKAPYNYYYSNTITGESFSTDPNPNIYNPCSSTSVVPVCAPQVSVNFEGCVSPQAELNLTGKPVSVDHESDIKDISHMHVEDYNTYAHCGYYSSCEQDVHQYRNEPSLVAPTVYSSASVGEKTTTNSSTVSGPASTLTLSISPTISAVPEEPKVNTTSVIISTSHRVGVITKAPAQNKPPVLPMPIPVPTPHPHSPTISTVTESSTQEGMKPEIKEAKQNVASSSVTSEDDDSAAETSSINPNIIIRTGKKNEPKYKCKVCKKKFKSKNNIKYHIHNEEDMKFPYVCPHCGKGMIGSTHYRYHLQKHENDRPFACTECSKCFYTSQKLERHKRTHNKAGRKKCTQCNRTFLSDKELSQHVASVHERREKHECKLCDKKFPILSQLREHESTHTGTQKFACEVCSKRFTRLKHLDNHRLIHAANKPVKCEKCGKEFRTDSSLRHHMKNHMDDRPFSCTTCGRAFVLQKDLIRHEKIHSKEDTFKCSACEKTFRRKDNLLRHEKMYHMEEQANAVAASHS